jgi:aldehyde dehydrogenase (NAD+)
MMFAGTNKGVLMKHFTKHYINGQFVESHGKEEFELINPSTGALRGTVRLGDEVDVDLAIKAAKEAFKTFSKTTLKERADLLDRLSHAFAARKEEHMQMLVEEYGGTQMMAKFSAERSINYFQIIKNAMLDIEFSKTINKAIVKKEAIGVAALITPWNSSSSFVCTKFATAIAAGCTVVVKPSEMSANQTQLLLECFHEAGIPKGVFNLINGRGDVAGAAIVRSPDVAKISFTGSTAVGKWIAREGAETLKRVTLELGGKSPNILLDDADLKTAIPFSLGSAYMNNGQACIAGTRLLVPENKLQEVKTAIADNISSFKVGNPSDESVVIGPMVSKKQFERVQSYIQKGIDEGAEVFIGGLGKPAGLENGNFVKPTVFINVNNNMTIAREEIFGPVLSILTYKTEEEAIAIANDTTYGLAGYLSSSNRERALKVADQIEAGRININVFADEPLAPFGGYKQSGLGRENGLMGIESFLETKTIFI